MKRQLTIGLSIACALVLVVTVLLWGQSPKRRAQTIASSLSIVFPSFSGWATNPSGTSVDRTDTRRSQAAFYRMRAGWPPDSFPISHTTDPLEADFSPYGGRSKASANGPAFQHWLSKSSYAPDEVVIVNGFFRNANGEPSRGTSAAIDVLDRRANSRVLVTVSFRDDGKDGDEVANDGRMVAAFAIPGELRISLPGTIQLGLRATIDGVEIRDAIIVNAGRLAVHPDGLVTDRIAPDEQGRRHLFVDVPVTVDTPGRYRVEGTLSTADGRKVAWAARASNLQAGTHVLTLRFFGKVLCDSKLDGPYQLSLGLSGLGGVVRSAILKNVHTTPAYSTKDVSCEPFNDPIMLQKAAEAERTEWP